MSLMSRSSGKDWCSLTKTTLRITCDALSKHSDCNFSDWQVQPHIRLSASGFQCTLLLQIFGTVAQLGAFTSSHVTQIQRLPINSPGPRRSHLVSPAPRTHHLEPSSDFSEKVIRNSPLLARTGLRCVWSSPAQLRHPTANRNVIEVSVQ
jgi:hypothetical protein